MFNYPGTQDALSKPEEWNSSWERLYTAGLLSPQINLEVALKNERFKFTTGELAFQYSALLQMTLQLLSGLGKDGVSSLLNDNLESKWLAATPAVRRKYALIGLSEACSIARNLNEARRFTGDVLTLDNLSKDGRSFIDLLKSIIPDDISVHPKTLYYIPNPAWDSFLEARQNSGTEFEKLWLAEAQLLRTKLICVFLPLRIICTAPMMTFLPLRSCRDKYLPFVPWKAPSTVYCRKESRQQNFRFGQGSTRP